MEEIKRRYARALAADLERERQRYSAEVIRELVAIAEHDSLGIRLLGLSVEHAIWSQKTFGSDSDRGPLGPLRHLEREAVEAQQNPVDILEFADCLLLLLDASRRAGFSLFDLIEGARRKLAINKEREWSTPSSGDEPVEHVRRIPELGVSGGSRSLGDVPVYVPEYEIHEQQEL